MNFRLIPALFLIYLASISMGLVRATTTPGTSLNFTLIGQNTLFERGLNAAPAIFDHFLYVGSRTDGSSRCGIGDPRGTTTGLDSCPHVHPGILVLDIGDPANLTIVGEFGTEFVTGANVGQTSRELRVWPDQGLLMVMYFRCSTVIHACPPSTQAFRIRFFDLFADPINPPLIATYVPSFLTHEMFLWVDPKNDSRALLWLSAPTLSVNPARPNLIITDISGARQGVFTEIGRGNWNPLFPGASTPANYDFDLALHSIGVSADGTRTYLAYLRGTFLVLNTTVVVKNLISAGQVENLTSDLLTPVASRPLWGAGNICAGGTSVGCAESHSAVKVPGRPFALTTDEVYGTFTAPSFGWPWGWARLIDVEQPESPQIVGEFKIDENQPAFQSSVDSQTQQFTSFSSHNPTLTRNLAFIAWHSGGLQAIDISDPTQPVQAGFFSPTPLSSVANEDPALSRGPNKVVMWSYPILHDGIIFVIDIRNGLFVLRYTGPFAAEVSNINFLEGNSNLGDFVKLDKPFSPGASATRSSAVSSLPPLPLTLTFLILSTLAVRIRITKSRPSRN